MKKFTLKALFIACFYLLSLRSQGQQDVLTQHNDLNRTGWNPNETILNQSNVTPTSFGLLFRKSVDDQIYAQPLVASGVNINGAAHNVVFVATVNNSVYAFDTEDGTADALWQTNLTMSGKMPPNGGDVHSDYCSGYQDIQAVPSGLGQKGSFGIIGTPVIDRTHNAIYLVARSRDLSVDNGTYDSAKDYSSTGFYQQFHALSLSTGNDTLGSPVNLDQSIAVPGTGDGHDGSNLLHFDPRRENQRPGLVLYNNVVYVSYASHCDMNYYHGWILGFNAGNSTLVTKYVTTPNDGRGGIWMSGAAPAVDASGVFYFATGNALDGAGVSQDNMGLRVVRAKPSGGTFTNISNFKPQSYAALNHADYDFGTGVLLIPSANLLVTALKNGNIALLRETPTVSGEYDETDATNWLRYINIGPGNESHSSLNYYGGTAKQFVYQFSENTNITAYPVVAGPDLGTPVINTTVPTSGGTLGGFMSGSSNGATDASSILWVEHSTTSGGALVALKADDITQQLWSSDALPVDNLGYYSKMNCPTIANGKVFAPTFSNSLNVYGLLAGNPRCVNNAALGLPAANYASLPNAGGMPAANAFDDNTGTRWAIGGAVPQYLYVDLAGQFDICKVSIHWNQASGSFTDYATEFTIDISDDFSTWNTINTVTGNSFTANPAINEFNEHATGRYVRINITHGGAAGTSITEMQVFGSPANNCIAPTGLSAVPTQNSATLSWTPVAGSQGYVVKYKSGNIYSYITRNVPNTGNPVTLNISALSCGVGYTYLVQNDCGSGSLSDAASGGFSALNCSSPCLNAQHFFNADLGDIAIAGSSCFDGVDTYTVTGSGNGLGARSDQFQFEYKSYDLDNDYIVHVASQDVIAPGNNNLAGLMIRDSLTDISRSVFIGKSGDNSKIYLIYRTSPGAISQTITIAKPAGADYYRISNASNQFSAFYSTTAAGPWTQIGSTQAIPFVGPSRFVGMTTSSLSTTSLSTATFDNYSDNSTPLPVELINFTANNVNNQYTSLNWQTAMEANNDHFEIERSSSGSNFVNILNVKAQGNGNSDTLQSYNDIDRSPVLGGFDFYRIKQIDKDSHFSYSPVQIVKFGTDIAPLVFPNPVNTLFNAIPGSEPIKEIVIYNVQGRAVQFIKSNFPTEQMKVNISQLSKGVYILKIKTDSKVYQVKIVKE